MKLTKRCTICGQPYVTTNINAKYCSDDCRKAGTREINRQARAEQREKEEKRKNSQQCIIDIAVLARQAGMTYGQYVSKMGL